MLELSREDRTALRLALISGFRSYPSLDRFVVDNFDFRLNEISSSQDTEGATDSLIVACEERGEELVLVLALNEVRPNNSAVQDLMRRLQGKLPGDGFVARAEVNHELMPGGEDSRSTHLVVAVFWEKPSEQKLRVQPKFCCRDLETRAILQESLLEEDCSVFFNDFPAFLKELIDFTIRTRLLVRFNDPIHPWRLTVELFVPLDLLCSPLTKWCGQDGELIGSRPIVIGCSDRFDPNKPGVAADLHNQLKDGWQRFQGKIPDHRGLVLQGLAWLDSDVAHQRTFEEYSGFRCYGEWLRPDAQHLENWQKLIKSGIPLAFWMCEGQPERGAIEETFNRLTSHTRFDFLEQIPRIRNEQRRTYNHCVGIFYEDPNYVPEVPLPQDEQFFSWPGT